MASFQSLTINGNQAYNAGNIDKVIARGNPASSSTLTLSSFNDVHYYYGDGVSSLTLATTMLENAVYEVNFCVFGSTGTNADMSLYPNYTTYSNAFTMYYWADPAWTEFNQTMSYVYFDHYGGSLGNMPCGRIVINNHRTAKFVEYIGGDTASVVNGTCRWNDTTTQWTNVGTLTGITTGNLRAFVRRIG